MGSGGAERTAKRLDALASDFQRTDAPDFAWKTVCSAARLLPGLRGFWPMSQFRDVGHCIDQSGQDMWLTYTGNPQYNVQGLATYIDFDGTGDCLNRLDEANLDCTGGEAFVANAIKGVSLGGWFKVDAFPGAGTDQLMGKGTPAADTAFYLGAIAAGNLVFVASNTGIGGGGPATPGAVALATWYFVAGVFVPSTSLNLWVGDNEYTAATAWATLNNSAGSFCIGGMNGASWFLNGKA